VSEPAERPGAESNVEIVQELYRRAAQDGRFPDESLADEIEWVNPPDAVETGTRRGREAFHKAMRSTGEAFDQTSVEPQEWVDAGDQVVLLCTWVVRGRASGLERRQPQGHVWTLRDGKAVRFAWFNDHALALREAGLEP
jgi:ketosteroid isomerase-like protein